ncbi:MAG: DUF4956 domain-containing protein [Erysipelotrichaceae bacterium]|jgi:hypothetical protein|nr:DUF4956 domain-containing protein [Erysipelotrichaceae bacterium]
MGFFDTFIADGVPNIGIAILVISLALVGGIGFAVLYCLLKQKEGYYKDIPITYAVFPVLVTILTIAIFLIPQQYEGSTNAIRFARVGVALVAAFAVFRFRTNQRTTEDMTYLLFLVGTSLLLGLGYIYLAITLYALIFTLVLLLYLFKFPFLGKRNLNLRITIPEDLNYEDAFTDILAEYTSYQNLTKVRTSDLGTMFVLNYEIVIKAGKSTKELVDKIRTRNGNLNIVLTVKKFSSIDEK